MPCSVYKLKFNRVHFGDGTLESTNNTIPADKLFSALVIEANKKDGRKGIEKLLLDVKNGLRISDLMPYKHTDLFLPKPILQFESQNDNYEINVKKLYKKLHWLILDEFADFLNGQLGFDDDNNRVDTEFSDSDLGTTQTIGKAEVRTGGDARPYRTAVYEFKDDSGLYLIVQNPTDYFVELLTSLQFTGLGGERSSGLGRFSLKKITPPDILTNLLQSAETAPQKMLISAALPMDDELEGSLAQATYLLKKSSGFVSSSTFSDTFIRKKDIFKFASGSVFTNTFDGQIADVGENGVHPVYSYAHPMFIGIERKEK